MKFLMILLFLLPVLPASATGKHEKHLVESQWCRKRYISGEWQVVQMIFAKSQRYLTQVFDESGDLIMRQGGIWSIDEDILSLRAHWDVSEARLSFWESDGFMMMNVQELNPKRGNGKYRFMDCRALEE